MKVSNDQSLTAEVFHQALDTLTTGSIRDAEDALTRDPDVSLWLHDEALRAAMQIGQEGDIQSGINALTSLVAEARDRYNALDEAIGETTKGHARLGVHLDPLNPDHSHLKVAFRNGRHYDAFRTLESLDETSALSMIDSLVAMMPTTTPFAGHPHVHSALVVSGEASLKLTVEAAASGGQARETFRIDATGFQPVLLSSRIQACKAILQYFGYASQSDERSAR
jgi:hypothetical protein